MQEIEWRRWSGSGIGFAAAPARVPHTAAPIGGARPSAVEQVAFAPLPASFEQAAVLGGGAALAEMLRHRLFPSDLISTVSVLYHDYEDSRS